MIRIAPLILLICAGAAAAEDIYRWSSEDGSVTYSDQPPPPEADEKQRIKPDKLPRLQVVPSVTAPDLPVAAEDQQTRPYQLFSIAQPQAGSAVRANDGDLVVVVNIQPGLRIDTGHRLRLYLDGKPAAEGTQTTFNLAALDRGEHSVHAEVLDRAGKPLFSTDTVSFTLLRHSRLF